MPGDAGARNRAAGAFRARWSAEAPLFVRAPGRVNLIGDHTDYNGGFVLPMTVDRETWMALEPRADGRVTIVSEHEPDAVRLDLADLGSPLRGWGAYVQGVAWALRAAGHDPAGFDGAVASDVPVGAGLSSSAALELAAAHALLARHEDIPSAVDLARLAQRAENEWVGVTCGIMDQLAIAAGRDGHALLIDCRSLETRPVPLSPRAAVLVLDTSTRRGLVDSAYNRRHEECEAIARLLGVESLRDADAALVERKAAALGPTLVRRAAHVISENARVQAAADALATDDLERAGTLMAESHESLRRDFEVSSDALDALVGAALSQPGCHGARMTGAGFGGCAVALVDVARAGDVADAAAARYHAETGLSATVHVCRPVAGASLVTAAPHGAA